MTDQSAMSSDLLLNIYRRAALMKANDERTRKVIRTGKLVMPYYSYRGQEIIPAALSEYLRDDDYICTIYRGIHDMIGKGYPLNELWAEIAGRQTGSCKGKGGCMHLTYPKKGIMVTTGVVGSTMPIANGLAWAAQIKGTDQVSVANFGDGASNIGAFHESLNLAAVWDLPTIFVCQNNLYAEHTTYEKCTAGERVADRAHGYGIPGVRVNGNDPVEMAAAAKDAIDRARAGEGPTLIEAMTFRFNGHVLGDADGYIPKEQKEAAIAADPVPALRQNCLDQEIATEEQLKSIDDTAERMIDEALQFALDSPWPDLSELQKDVLAEEIA